MPFNSFLLAYVSIHQVNIKIIKYIGVALKFLHNIPDEERISALAEDEVSKVATHNDKQHIPYDIFCELFASFIFRYVENVDIISSKSFLELLFNRTTKTIFLDTTSTFISHGNRSEFT